MKLPFSFWSNKKKNNQFFLLLLLADEAITAIIIQELDKKITIVSHAQENFLNTLESANKEELLEIIDSTVSTTEDALPKNVQIEKTIFGVKQEWVESGKIKQEYLLKLKNACDQLALKPIGFLVFTEAILHALSQEEGAPVSAILIEVGRKIISLSLIRAGRIIDVKQIDFQEPIAETVDNGLKKFDVEILPARIIIFNTEYSNQISRQFIKHTWSKSLPFLHVPQITILPSDFDIKGILLGTAAQMGYTVADNILIPEKVKLNKHDLEKKQELVFVQPEEDDTPAEIEVNPVSEEYFGFLKNKDITATAKKTENKKDIPLEDIPGQVMEDVFEEIPEEVKQEETAFETQSGALPIQGNLLGKGIKISLSKIVHKFSKKIVLLLKPKQKEKKSIFPRWIFYAFVPVIFIIGIIAIYILFLKSTITITVTPKIIEYNKNITFSIDGENDFSKNILASHSVEIKEQGTLTADATGTKQVGTQSKGKITIFSRLTNTTKIPKGTIVLAANNVSFTLDDNVTIASFSGDTTDPSISVADIAITARDVGPEANIPSGTKFSIDGLNKADISAKNDNPFSGGTKKDITVVSQKDIDGLLIDLKKNLSQKANNELSQTSTNNSSLIPIFIKEEIINKKLTNQVNDQVKTVGIDSAIKYTAENVDKKTLQDFTLNTLKNKLPDISNLFSSNIQTDITDPKLDKDTLTSNLHMKAIINPKININDISSKIAGKSYTQALLILKNINQVSQIDIALKPQIPFLPKILPQLPQNINIVISSNE